MVAFGPRFASLETESFRSVGGSAETLAGKPLKRETPRAETLGVGR